MTKKYILVADDVVDNLTSDDSTVPLSAKQGKVLNDGKVAISQGTGKNERVMSVNSSGNVRVGISIQSGTAEPATGFVGTPQKGDIYIRYSA